MEYKEPTYEEYKKATTYAKVRYRFGAYIQLIAFLFLIFLFVYVVINVEELKTHPLEYTQNKLGITCNCFNENNPLQEYKLKDGNVGSNQNIGKE